MTTGRELGTNEDLKRSQKIQNHLFCRGHCARMDNGNNMLSVHDCVQATKERTTKPNSEQVVTSGRELGANEDLKWSPPKK